MREYYYNPEERRNKGHVPCTCPGVKTNRVPFAAGIEWCTCGYGFEPGTLIPPECPSCKRSFSLRQPREDYLNGLERRS